LPNPPNGNVTLPSQTVVNSTASYTCKTGYRMIGDSSRRCLASGVWGGVEPVCVASSKTDLFANLIQFEHDDLIIVYKITHLFVTSAYFIHFCYRCFAENMSFRNRLPWNCVERNLSQSDEKIRLCCSFERYCFLIGER